MARTLLQAVLNTLQSSGATQGMLDAPFVASDPPNFNNFTATGHDLLTIYNADVPGVAPVTGVQVLNGVVTVTAVNQFVKGQAVVITGLTTATYLNSQTLSVSTSTGSQFTANFSHSDTAPITDSGTTTAAGSSHTLTVHSFADPQGRVADVTYNIAAGKHVSFWIPSIALYTQTDGTVWFDCTNASLQLMLTH